MKLQLTTRDADGIIIVDAVGRLTLTDSNTRLRDLIHVFSGNGRKFFLLNLSGVEFIDSDGMGELARCFSTVRQNGGDLKLVQVNEKVRHLLEITRVITLFEVYSDEKEALRACGTRA
jgi:anti-sigma B factor antagonist